MIKGLDFDKMREHYNVPTYDESFYKEMMLKSNTLLYDFAQENKMPIQNVCSLFDVEPRHLNDNCFNLVLVHKKGTIMNPFPPEDL